jgi:hypothetical protein
VAAVADARVARAGLVLAAVVVTAEATAQLVDFWALQLRQPALDSSSDDGIFVRIGTFALLACALATLSLARRRVLPLALAAVVGWLFVDELLDVHSQIPHWTLAYVPLLALVLAGYWRLSRSFAGDTQRLVRGGLLLLVASAAIHLAGPHLLAALGWGPDAWEYQVKIALKEGTEIGGWLVLASGLAATRRSGRRARRRSGRATVASA